MKLLSLKLENVYAHRLLEVEFQQGLVGILGPNGSGKSTSMHAVYAALTNDFKRNPGGKEGAVRQNTDPALQSKITLQGKHLDNQFSLVRTLYPMVKNCLYLGDAKYTKAGDIQRELEETLGADRQLLDRYVFVEQWQLHTLFQQTDAERARTLAHLCRTTHAEACWELLGKQMEIDRALVVDPGISLDQVRAELARYTKQLKDTRSELKKLRAKQTDAAVEADDRKTIADFLRRRELRDGLPGDKETVAKFLAIAKEATSLLRKTQKERKEVTSALTVARDELHQLEILAAKFEAESARLTQRNLLVGRRDKMMETLSHLSDSQPKFTDTATPLAELKESVTELKRQRSPAEMIVRDFGSLASSDQAECPTCHQPLHDVQEQVREAKEMLASTAEQLKLLEKAVAAREAFDRQLADWKRSCKDAQLRLDEVIQELESMGWVQSPTPHDAAKLASLAATVKTAENRTKLLASQESEQMSSRATAIANHRSAKLVLAGHLRDLDDLKVTADEANAAKARLKEIDQVNNAIVALTVREEEYQRMRVECGSRVEEVAKVAERSEIAKQWLGDLDRSRDALHRDKLPRLLHRRTLQEMEDAVNETLESFESPFHVRTADDLSYTAHFRDGTVMPDRGLSGGQQVILAIALRWVLHSRFASQIGMMVLDEPTAGLDPRHVDLLEVALRNLGTLARQRDFQVIIITHEQGLSRVFDQVIQLDRSSV